MNPTVLVVQEQVPPYRLPFFRFLSGELSRRDLQLLVASSSDLPATAELGFQHRRVPASRYGRPALELAYRERPAVLVLPHSGRVAPAAAAARFSQHHRRRLLLWGMGLARRYGIAAASDRQPTAEAVRRLMLSTCDHYLSYTELSTASLLDSGYDSARITTLNNAVEALATDEQATAACRIPLKILFIASLVEDKEPLTAVEITDRLRRRAPGVTLHIVGDGPLRSRCERATHDRQWVHCHGTLRGEALRELALSSDIALIPGRVGLAVLEMASAGLPLATFSNSLHGAEIAYLQDGINGLLLSRDIDAAADRLGALLTDRSAVERMRGQALKTAQKYTIRGMAANFANGVLASL